MEKENITLETKQTLREQLFMQSWGQQFTVENSLYQKGKIYTVSGITRGYLAEEHSEPMIEFFENGKIGGVSISSCVLLKKPLGRVSQYGKAQVNNLYLTNPEHHEKLLEILQDNYVDFLECLLLNTSYDYSPVEVSHAIDQLREWGYALPYKHWSVEQLVEFGIYKLIEK